MIFGNRRRLPVLRADFGGRLEDGAGLHFGDFRIGDRRAARRDGRAWG